MKIILKSGQVLNVDTITPAGGGKAGRYLLKFTEAGGDGEVLLSEVKEIWDAQTYDNALANRD